LDERTEQDIARLAARLDALAAQLGALLPRRSRPTGHAAVAFRCVAAAPPSARTARWCRCATVGRSRCPISRTSTTSATRVERNTRQFVEGRRPTTCC
jgi:hypothetical protein